MVRQARAASRTAKKGKSGMPSESAHLSYEEIRLLKLLMETEKLSLAGQSLGLSVSTVSRQLSHAREILGDPLFVRSKTGLLPTPKMVQMSRKIAALLSAWESLSDDAPFSPAAIDQPLRIMTADNGFNAYLTEAVPRIHREAPKAQIVIDPLSADIFESLRRDEVDCVIFPAKAAPADCRAVPLPRMHNVLLVRRGHPLEKRYREAGALAPEEIAAWTMVYTDPRLSMQYQPPTAMALSAAPAFLVLPYFNSAPQVLARSDYYMWCPAPTARLWTAMTDISALDADAEGRYDFTPQLIWHERTHHDPVCQWLRGMIASCAQQVAEAAEAIPSADAAEGSEP